jgi:hypothetical protein
MKNPFQSLQLQMQLVPLRHGQIELEQLHFAELLKKVGLVVGLVQVDSNLPIA